MMDFWSKSFSRSSPSSNESKNVESQAMKPTAEVQIATKAKVPPSIRPPVPFGDRHPFIQREVLQPRSRKTQALVADFRANGPTIKRPPICGTSIKPKEVTIKKISNDLEGQLLQFVLDSYLPKVSKDANSDLASSNLNLRCPFLYSNYSNSKAGKNESPFCVYPSSIMMDIVSSGGLTLGSFLENYCFRSDYKCPNNECTSTLICHDRRFCYSNGSVLLTIQEKPSANEKQAAGSKDGQSKDVPEDEQVPILTSTKCHTCNYESTMSKMSPECLSMSFGKFLMLQICGQEHLKASNPATNENQAKHVSANENQAADVLHSSRCGHNVSFRHVQKFTFSDIAASFEYKEVKVRGIKLPPLEVKVHLDYKSMRELICEELKKISVRGWETHGVVHERVSELKEELSGSTFGTLIQELCTLNDRDRNEFRKHVESIQVDLCSKNQDMESMYQVYNSLFFLKRQIVQFVDSWNSKFHDLYNKRKKEAKSSSSNVSTMSNPGSFSSMKPSSSIQTIPEHVSTMATDSPPIAADGSTMATDSSPSDSQVLEQSSNSDTMNQSATSNKSNDSVFKSVEVNVGDDILTPDVISLSDDLDKMSFNSKSDDSSSQSIKESDSDTSPRVLKCSGINPMLGDDGLESSYDNVKTLTADDVDALRREEQMAASATVLASKKAPQASRSSKTSLKNIMSQFLNSGYVPEFDLPFGINEHYMLPVNQELPILVRDEDTGSMISFALASTDYENQLAGMMNQINQLSRSVSNNLNDAIIESYESQVSVNSANSGVSFKNNQDQDSKITDQKISLGQDQKITSSSLPNDGHIEVTFEDSNCKFTVNCYCAENFRKLRAQCIKGHPQGQSQGHECLSAEEIFIRSLSSAIEWKAVGGKSGARFRKTLDERFIIKEMNDKEIGSFKLMFKKYFEYLDNVIKNKQITTLAKVLGVYRVSTKSKVSNTSSKIYVLVIENLFYKSTISQVFDLKGSSRNRVAGINNDVKLDTDLVQLLRDSPLYVRPDDKKQLQAALNNDTTFLQSLDLMDYSLLVGVDDSGKQLIVGIIDYIRSFTWDKRVESIVKSSVSKELSTIVKPDVYQDRFLSKMSQYFLPVPDKDSKLDHVDPCSTVIVL